MNLYIRTFIHPEIPTNISSNKLHAFLSLNLMVSLIFHKIRSIVLFVNSYVICQGKYYSQN